jgi:phage-related protein
MIVYDGISLNSIAGIKVKDVQVSPIAYDEITRPRAIRGGSDFVRSRAGTRTVAITFALIDENDINRQASLLAISQWAKNDKEYRLELPGHPDRYLMAICTGKPEPSLRQWWESKLRLVFTCYENPYWNAKAEKSVACGTAAYILGDAPPLMRIERTVTGSAASNQSYSLDGKTITFSSIPVGNTVIDLNRQLAYSVNGTTVTDLMPYYNVNSRFLVPRTGSVTITGTGTVKYRERWQ